MTTSRSESKQRLLRILKIGYIVGLCSYPLWILMASFSDQGDSWFQMEWWQLSLFLLLFTSPILAAWLVTFPSIRYLALREKSKAAPKCEMVLAGLCTAMPMASLMILVVFGLSFMGVIADDAMILFFGLPILTVLCGVAALILHKIVRTKERASESDEV